MKLHDLMERRMQRTKIMYHGTSDVFLQSILKHGLMANPPKRVYGGDADDPGPAGYETFGGIYLTDQTSLASSAAQDAREKFGGQPIIVHVQYVLGSGNLDEDLITNPIQRGLEELISGFYSAQDNEGDHGDEDWTAGYNTFTDYEQENREQVMDEIADGVYDKVKQYGTPNARFMLILQEAINYLLDHVDEDMIYVGTTMSELRNHPMYIQMIEKMMASVNDDPLAMKNIQVTRDIGFRGKTRIVKITRNGFKDEIYRDPNWNEYTDY